MVDARENTNTTTEEMQETDSFFLNNNWLLTSNQLILSFIK